MKTVLVTGGAGFIGSAFVRMLASDSHLRIVNVDSLTYAGNLESLPGIAEGPRYLFCRTDICDNLAIRAILAQNKPDAIMHFAAESHVDRSIDCPTQFITTNVFGTFTLLQESLDYWRSLEPSARRNFRFVHVSTDEVFGCLGATGHFTESTAYSPNSPYSASKASSDHLVRAWHRTYGFPSVTTNCSNNYGPFQFPEKLIPLMVLRALAGKELPVYGQGKNVRDWLYVDDHCRALLAVLKNGKPGETYNIGGSNEIRNIDVVEAICRIVDEISPSATIPERKLLITFVQDRPGHDFRYAVDASKIGRELGWKALETFQSGLQKTVEWYVANQTWTERVQSGAYRGERLGMAVAR